MFIADLGPEKPSRAQVPDGPLYSDGLGYLFGWLGLSLL